MPVLLFFCGADQRIAKCNPQNVPLTLGLTIMISVLDVLTDFMSMLGLKSNLQGDLSNFYSCIDSYLDNLEP